ncbi:MAG: sugar phosphate isomerase/epimerase family protein [Planctomycetota bacterium]
MAIEVGRRGFIAGAVGLVTGGIASPDRERNLRHRRTKFSLAAYGYRDLLNVKQPQMSLFEFVDECVAFGLEGTELTSYYFPDDVSDEFLRKLKQHCFRQGIEVSGTAIGNDFGFPAGPDRDKQVALTRRWIERAEILGAPVIRIFAGHQKPGVDAAEADRLMIAGMEEACAYAGEHGVTLALENHGGPTATADGLLKFVEAVKSPWFGVNLDTGNFHSDDVYGDLARVAPYAVNVQVNVSITEKGVKQPVDFKRLAKILQAAEYKGYVVLEYEEAEEPRGACKRYLEELRVAFAEG